MLRIKKWTLLFLPYASNAINITFHATCYALRSSQSVVTSIFGSYTMLSRCAFLSQHARGDMLAASDPELLEALSVLADIDRFQVARATASKEARELQYER